MARARAGPTTIFWKGTTWLSRASRRVPTATRVNTWASLARRFKIFKKARSSHSRRTKCRFQTARITKALISRRSERRTTQYSSSTRTSSSTTIKMAKIPRRSTSSLAIKSTCTSRSLASTLKTIHYTKAWRTLWEWGSRSRTWNLAISRWTRAWSRQPTMSRGRACSNQLPIKMHTKSRGSTPRRTRWSRMWGRSTFLITDRTTRGRTPTIAAINKYISTWIVFSNSIRSTAATVIKASRAASSDKTRTGPRKMRKDWWRAARRPMKRTAPRFSQVRWSRKRSRQSRIRRARSIKSRPSWATTSTRAYSSNMQKASRQPTVATT